MKWRNFVIGLVVLGAFGYGVYLLKGPNLRIPLISPTRKVALKKGSGAKILLLAALASGEQSKGDRVPVILAENVVADDGTILMEAGEKGLLEVTRSREASAVTSLMNQPARLEVTFLPLKAIDGQKISLVADASAPDEPYKLTRENTNGLDAGDALEDMWKHEEVQGALTKLSDKFTGKNPSADLSAPDMQKVLADVAKKMNMTNTEAAVKSGKTWDEVMKAAQSVQSGNLNGLNGQELLLAVNALGELGKLAGSVDKTLRGTIKGRNISAPVGTALKAQVAKDYTIVLK